MREDIRWELMQLERGRWAPSVFCRWKQCHGHWGSWGGASRMSSSSWKGPGFCKALEESWALGWGHERGGEDKVRQPLCASTPSTALTCWLLLPTLLICTPTTLALLFSLPESEISQWGAWSVGSQTGVVFSWLWGLQSPRTG